MWKPNGVISVLLAIAVLTVACSSGSSHGGTHSSASNGPAQSPPSPSAAVNGWAGPMADDLAAPSSDVGLQVAVPEYDPNDPNARLLIVQPGQEIFLCFYVTIPNDIEIGGFRSWMTEGSSHHFILYQQNSATQPSGTINACSFGGTGTWLYGTSTPGQIVGMDMPQGVGLPMSAGTQVMLNMHFINPGDTVIYPKMKVNILYAKDIQYKAGVVVSFNRQINVPPATSDGPGTQTVSGTCHATAGSQFFQMATHTHKHGTTALIQLVHGDQTTELVHTGPASTYPADQAPGTGTDYQHPGVGVWNAPNFLTLAQGDYFTYSCSYENDSDTAVRVGQLAATNEMCMMMAYYFPVASSSCN
jgi:Copper type II ascorbate-dependent monooxygenase, C-terminal domain